MIHMTPSRLRALAEQYGRLCASVDAAGHKYSDPLLARKSELARELHAAEMALVKMLIGAEDLEDGDE